nr:metaxin-3 [Leptinotarsa decemlineata]
MSVQDKFQLVVYDGDFSLPSVDIECLKSIVYTTIAGVPVQVRLLDSVKQCTFYSAPSFVHKNLQFKSFNESVLYLRTLNYNLDGNLTAKQCSETLAITNLVLSKLKPVLEFYYWVDQRNSEEFTSVWFMKALPFPFNYLHTRRFKEKSLALIESLYPTETNLDVIKEFLQRAALECLSSLSTRLGNSDYFHGTDPTSLDIIVYSYVSPFMKLPFPSNDILTILTMWPNLKNLVKRIDAKYFRNLPRGPKYLRVEEKVKTSDEEVSYVAILILTLSATTLALGFAFNRGLFSTRVLY